MCHPLQVTDSCRLYTEAGYEGQVMKWGRDRWRKAGLEWQEELVCPTQIDHAKKSQKGEEKKNTAAVTMTI